MHCPFFYLPTAPETERKDMREDLKDAIRSAVNVPDHIKQAAYACASDLMNGPAYSQKPESGNWEDFEEDDWGHVPSDFENPISVYAGPVGEMLRDFINEIPTLYTNQDQDDVFENAPQGEEIDGEWCEPEPYFEVSSDQVIEALFGKTIAKEFN